MSTDSHKNLREFAAFVKAAPTNPKAEKFVRSFLGNLMASCPMECLTQVAETVIRFRKQEMAREAEAN